MDRKKFSEKARPSKAGSDSEAKGPEWLGGGASAPKIEKVKPVNVAVPEPRWDYAAGKMKKK